MGGCDAPHVTTLAEFFVYLFNFSQLDAYLKAVGKLYHPSTWRDRISLSSHKQ